jgi:hypothetical protein
MRRRTGFDVFGRLMLWGVWVVVIMVGAAFQYDNELAGLAFYIAACIGGASILAHLFPAKSDNENAG